MEITRTHIPFYGIFIVLGILLGFIYIYKSLLKDGYKDKNIRLYILLYIAFSFVFGKIFTLITDNNTKSFLTAGLSSYGGLIGVILGAFIFEQILNTDKKIIKYSIISLPLVYGVSKIGCFMAGCCYGIPYNGFLSVIYPEGLNISLFPVQLLESITFILLFIILNKYKNSKNIIYITIILSAILKFILDFLRYEHITKTITTNQIVSIIIILITILILPVSRKLTKTQ